MQSILKLGSKMLELKPLAEEKREWFIGSLQWAFK